MSAYRADLHCHTNRSFDCSTPVETLVRATSQAGLQAVAVTDHDVTIPAAETDRLSKKFGIQVIPGVEITTEGGTHVVALFVDQYPKDLNIFSVLAFIKEQGGVSILPHLFRSDTGLIYNHEQKGQFSEAEVKKVLQTVDLLEINNFKSQLRGEPRPGALAKQYAKPVVASTDSHYPFEVGKSFTSFDLSGRLNPENILTADRRLDFYPIAAKPKVTVSVPLTHFQPSVSSVSRLKKIVPAGLVSGIGRGLSSWQRYGRLVEKRRSLETALSGLTLQELTPEEAITSSL